MPALASPSFVALLPRFALGLLLWMPTVSASADEKAQTRADAFGDPLPAGAIARLGTVRLRHADSILAIAFTPDGKQLVSAGEDAVRVWDAATGRPLRSFAPGTPQGTVWHHRDLQAASLSPDGRFIAISKYSNVRRVEVWDVTTGKLVHRLGKDCVFSRLCFSPDGKRLAALALHLTGGGQTIDLWDVATGEHVNWWPVSEGSVRSLTFSADGKALLVGGSEKALSFRDVSTGKEVRRLRDLPGDVDDLVLSPHGDRAAYIEWAETKVGDRLHRHEGVRAFLVDLRTGKELRRWAVPESERFLTSLVFSPDGNKVAACSCDGPLRLWDTKNGKEIKPLSGGPSIASTVAFSPNGGTLAAVCKESVVRLIDPTTGKNRVPATAHLGSVLLVTATRDGHTSFTAGADGIIYCWDTRNGRERRRLLGHPHCVCGLALSQDERALFSTGSEGTLRIWDVASGKERRQVRPSHFLGPFTLSPDGATLAACDFTRLLLFDPVRGKGRSEREMKNIAAIAFAPDSSSVTVLTRDGAISRVETRTNRVLSQWNVPDAVENAIRERVGALSFDGRLAAFAESYQILRVLDVEAKQEIRRLAKPPGSVSTIAFAPDNRTLAWAEGYGVIHWLEVASGSERRTLSGHVGRVMRMVFTADGKRLLSASEDATALVWDLLGTGATTLSAEQRDACWTDLADKDAARAYRAMRRLIAAPEDAFLCLRFRLKPVEGMDEKAIERLVVDLDSDNFAVREKATKELRKLGELAEPACRKALESRPTLEMSRRLRALLDEVSQRQWHLTPEILRQMRAVEVLERIGTPEARELLEGLSRGAAGARLSCEARAAAHRLAHRSGEQGPSTPR